MLNTSNDKILNEIGELFGRYREADGSFTFFQKKQMENINFGQLGQEYDEWLRSYTQNNPEPDKQEKDTFLSGVLSGDFYTQRFYDWQKRVIARLQNTSNDVYVVAPPGGGKTTPLMAHYMIDLFMGGKNGDIHTLYPTAIFGGSQQNVPPATVIRTWANIFTALLTKKYLDGKPVPKCLFVTPIRVLSFEQAEGFQDYFLDLVLLLKSLMMKATPINQGESIQAYLSRISPNPVQNKKINIIDGIVSGTFRAAGESWFKSMNVPVDGSFNSFAKSFTEKLIHVKTGGGSGSYDTPPEQAFVSIATYGSAKKFISKISNTVKFIVFDEAHLYMPSEYGPNSDRSQENEVRAAADAYTIVEGMAKQSGAQIAFLSGTIHPISAQNFCDFLNRRYGRNMAVVSTEKGDSQSGNKTELHVIPDDAIREEKEQVNRIVRWVQRNEKGNAIILFSKQKINKLVDEAMKRLSQKDIRSDFNVNQSDRYRKEKIDRYRRSLAYSNPDAGPDEIERSVNEFIKREFPSSQKEKIEKIKAKPGAMMIQNKKLRDAVSYGIGYIYTQDDIRLSDPRAVVGEVIEPIKEQDKLIVAKLFSEGKINVLIATAAIGVGVNVNIKNMYLPSCMKYEKNKNNEDKYDLNNKREMSQLVNRTGRGKTPISGIYTPSEFVPFMREIVMSGIEDFNKVPAIVIRPSDNLKDVLLNLSNAASTKYNKYTGFAKSIPGKITDKLNKFKQAAKEKIKERSDIYQQNQLAVQLGDPNVDAELDAAVKRHRADLERLSKYTNVQDRINDLETKLTNNERQIQDTEKKIRDLERDLAGINGQKLNSTTRSKYLRRLVRYRKLLGELQITQTGYIIDDYNAILTALDEIDNTTGDTDKRGIKSSKYNKDFLTRRLEEIRGRYNPKLLKTRNEAMTEFNRQLQEYNKHLEEVENKYQAIRGNSNVPNNIQKAVSTDIYNSRKFISQIIDRVNRIQYYNGLQARQITGSLRY